jgi:hypothetical protein
MCNRRITAARYGQSLLIEAVLGALYSHVTYPADGIRDDPRSVLRARSRLLGDGGDERSCVVVGGDSVAVRGLGAARIR